MNKINTLRLFVVLNILLGSCAYASSMHSDDETRGGAASARPATWELLTSEDTIHVVHPASGLSFKQPQDRAAWDSQLNTAVREHGLKGGITTHLETVDFKALTGYFHPANTEEERAAALKACWDDPKVKAIQWARGGFGGSETLALLYDAGHRPERQIPVFGFSDATAYHLYYPDQPFFHAPMAATNSESLPFLDIGNKNSSLKPMVDILMGNLPEVSYNLSVCHLGAGIPITSFIVGGNMSVVFRHNGTPQQLKADGGILFLEDFGDELCYRSASVFFTAAIRTGVINRSTKALFLGKMPRLIETESTAADAIKTRLAKSGLSHIPILYSDGFGHGDVNGILPFKTPAVVEFSKNSDDKTTATITIQTRK